MKKLQHDLQASHKQLQQENHRIREEAGSEKQELLERLGEKQVMKNWSLVCVEIGIGALQ